MRCLTICEPWAWAIVDLSVLSPTPKNVENRQLTFPRFSGPLLIHSGKGDRYKATWRQHVEFISSRSHVAGLGVPSWDDLQGRGIIGFAEQVECVQKVGDILHVPKYEAERLTPWQYNFRAAAEWAEGPLCLLLAGVTPFARLVPYRGQQGPFHVPDALVAEAIEEARERIAIRQFGGG